MFLIMEPAGLSRGKWRHQLLLKYEMRYTVVYELINAYKKYLSTLSIVLYHFTNKSSALAFLLLCMAALCYVHFVSNNSVRKILKKHIGKTILQIISKAWCGEKPLDAN